MENLNREIETVQKNQIETLELKSKTSKIKNKYLKCGLNSRLKKEEEQGSELENKSTESNPTEE